MVEQTTIDNAIEQWYHRDLVTMTAAFVEGKDINGPTAVKKAKETLDEIEKIVRKRAEDKAVEKIS
jgi:hypothetical protein